MPSHFIKKVCAENELVQRSRQADGASSEAAAGQSRVPAREPTDPTREREGVQGTVATAPICPNHATNVFLDKVCTEPKPGHPAQLILLL